MKMLFFVLALALALAGCEPPESRGSRMGKQLSQWVPDGTPMASARQIMETHGFTCSITSFGSLEQMTNHDEAILDGHLWSAILKRNGTTQPVTNLSYLDCKRTNNNRTCDVRFIFLNGEVEGHRAFGAL